MGLNSFTSMVSQLSSMPDHSLSKEKKMVARQEYEIFCKEFIFDQLKGYGFGEAFCKRFDMHDITLESINDDTAQFMIEHLGYLK